jgi:hypothetical protein
MPTFQCTLLTKGTEIPLRKKCNASSMQQALSCCEDQVREYLATVAKERIEMREWRQNAATIPDAFLKVSPSSQQSLIRAYDFSM